ncbi:uncharacterized protein LOC120172123 [Hibiscus syriacus]|uniref:uncharacterized protein LOC120172123 n=1 Tax=Hibiscus syriacus TaxID=106335 RepID=UPI0019207C3F|nr:uncharacterized protein LOC120172123 [Hibiscus syriacus]
MGVDSMSKLFLKLKMLKVRLRQFNVEKFGDILKMVHEKMMELESVQLGNFVDGNFSVALNGDLVGYFEGAQGVRQGDLLPPFLFVLSMNVLPKMLDVAAGHGFFNYHPKCHRIKLTHLCFTDDFLIFSKGSCDSMMVVWTILEQFYEFSGLKFNDTKNKIYSTGIGESKMYAIVEETGIRSSSLSVHYMGIP